MATNPSNQPTGAPKYACDQSVCIEAGTQFIERPSTPEPLPFEEEPLDSGGSWIPGRPGSPMNKPVSPLSGSWTSEMANLVEQGSFWEPSPERVVYNPPPCVDLLGDESEEGLGALATDDDVTRFIIMVRRQGLIREIFPNGEAAFPFRSWSRTDFDGWHDSEVIKVCLRAARYSMHEQQLALFEAFTRGYNQDVFRAMAYNHASIRERTVRFGRSVRSKAWKSQMWIKSARASHESTYQQAIEGAAEPLRHALLSDYVFGSPGFITIGSVRFETREEFRAAVAVFSRNKSLYRAILSASNPKIFEVGLTQKILSDASFSRKLHEFSLTRGQALQSGVLTPSSSYGDLETEGRDWVAEAQADPVNWAAVGEEMRQNQARFNKEAMWDASQRVARLAVSIKLLFSAGSMMDAIGVVYLYLSGESLGHLIPNLTEWFEARCGVELQSLGYSDNPTLADLFSSLVGFLGVTNVLGTMLGAAGDKLSVDFPLFQFLKDRFMSLSRQHNGDEKVTHFWATLKGFAGTLWECVKTRSLEPLFEAKLGPSALVARAEALTTYQTTICAPLTPGNIQTFNELKATGKIPLDWMRPWALVEYLEEVSDVHQRLKAILPITPSALLPLVNRSIATLQLKISTGADAFQSNAFRPMPLGVALVGPAGVGKSVLMDRLIACTAARRGFCDDASTRYMWAADANFQDGLTPQHIWYIMDDIDVSLTQPVRGQRDHVVDIMSVIDTKPFPVESARAEEKGKNFGRPLLVLYGSNNVDLKLATFIKEESAIRRRLRIHAHVLAKPEYRVGRGGVDWKKVETSGKDGGFDVDPHEIHVSLYDAATGNYAMLGVMGDSEFIRYVGSEFDRNLEEHSLRISREISSCLKCKTTVPKGDVTCRFCDAEAIKRSEQTLRGQQPSRVTSLLDTTERAAQRLDRLTQIVEDARTVEKVARVVDKTADFVENFDPVRGAGTTIKAAASATLLGLADFITAYPGVVAVALGALVAAIALSKLFSVELQGRVNNSMQTPSADFVRVSDTKPAKGSFVDVTYSYSQMVSALRKNTGTVASPQGRGARCVRVGIDLFIMNRHVIADILSEGNDFVLQFEGVSRRGTFTKDTIGQIGSSDLSLIRVVGVPAAPTALPYLWPSIDNSITAFDNVQMVLPDAVRESRHNWNALKISSNQGYCGPTVFYDIETESGDCGYPVIGEVNGRFRWVGIHHAGGKVVSFFATREFDARAPLFSKNDLAQVAARLGGTLNSARTLQTGLTTKEPMRRELRDERHSELACALVRGAEVVNRGNIDGFRLFSNTASSCKQSPFYDKAELICAEITGVRHYWEIPKLKGAMLPVDGGQKWHSGFQNVFLYLKPTQDLSPLYPAIIDYLRPLDDCDRVGYEQLSELEAIKGREGIPELKGVNMATSMGPPFHVAKSEMISADGSIDPRFREQIDEILMALEADEVPIPYGVCTLKDEPIKHSKNAVRDVRVFVCLMAAWNIVQKMYMFPIKMFLKNNPIVFESMVGIDMTGEGPGMLHRAFQIINPSLDLIVEGDYTKMDKSINGVVAWGVVEVFGRIARSLGLDERVVRLLVISNFHVMYSIQGDVFQAGAMNPSGSDITVEINAVANSLAHRAAWFQTLGKVATLEELLSGADTHLPDFRTHNTLVTYGDDFLLVHPEKRDLPELFSKFSALGFTVTDGQKAAEPQYRTFSQVTFLKRQFFVEGDTVYAGLDTKSICRMLMIFKKSSLSVVDHSGVVLEEALREIFLRRDQPFVVWRERLSAWAVEAKCTGSRYLRLLPFDDYQAMWDSKAFSSWKVEVEQQEVDESMPEGLLPWTSFPQTFQSKMTSLDIVPALGGLSSGVGATQTTAITTNLPSNAVSTMVDSAYGAVTAPSEGGVMMTHAVGDVSSLTAPVMAGSLGVRRNDQPMATASLAESLHRQVEIARFTTFSTPGAALAIRPWKNWQENDFVADKLRNFNFITGSIKVRGVCKAPPLCSGLVTVTAMPSYEPSVTPQVIPKHLVFVGSHVALDLSTSSDFEMVLPWVGSSNWGNLEDNLFERMWTITVRVMSPIQSTIPSGCASAVLQLYAVPGDDFELSGAVFQGRRPVVTRNIQTPAPSPYTGTTGAQAPAPVQDAARGVHKATGYKPSQLAGAGAWVAGAAGALVPSMAVPAGIVGGVLGVASKMLDYFGMTRETVPPRVDDAMLKTSTNLLSCDGEDTSRVVALFSSNRVSSEPSVAGGLSDADETALSFINGKYTWMGQATYVVGSTDDDDILIPVTPFLATYDDDNPMLFHPTTAGYVGSRFQYWRGDVKFLIYPVISAAIRGSLQFIWQPIPRDGDIAVDLTNISLNSIVDISPARPIEITIGFNNDLPMCYSDFYTMDTAISPADYNTLNGYLRIRVAAPFAGSVCGQSVHLHIFAAAGDNMEFAVPTDIMSVEGNLCPINNQVFAYPPLQSSGAIGADGQGVLAIELVPSSGVYPIVENLAGEAVRSVRALCQKPSTPGPFAGFTSETADIAMPHTPFSREFIESAPLGIQNCFNSDYFAWYGTMYLGFAGSVRHKFIVDRNSPGFKDLVENLAGSVMAAVPYMTPCVGVPYYHSRPLVEVSPTITDASVAVEYTLPYYHNELYVPAYKPILARQDFIALATAQPAELYAYYYRSAGPDARYVYFRAQNSFEFNVSVTTGGIDVTTQFKFSDPAELGLRTATLDQEFKIDLDQYRARTGREAVKPIGPKSRFGFLQLPAKAASLKMA